MPWMLRLETASASRLDPTDSCAYGVVSEQVSSFLFCSHVNDHDLFLLVIVLRRLAWIRRQERRAQNTDLASRITFHQRPSICTGRLWHRPRSCAHRPRDGLCMGQRATSSAGPTHHRTAQGQWISTRASRSSPNPVNWMRELSFLCCLRV